MLRVKPYEKVSAIYDGLMSNLDYASWSKYILLIAEENINEKSKILELGAGSCKIAEVISKSYKNYIATDISFPMLHSADNKNLKRICCDMSLLPFKKKFDFVFSAFDSVNYILKKKLLLNLFYEVKHLLEDNGIFTFDVSLEENSLNFLVSKTTEGHHNGNQYQMKSKYNSLRRIHSNNFYIWNDAGKKYKEMHKEKIYHIDTYFKLAEKVGLQIVACYDCFDFKDVTSKSKRAQFVMRKIN
jgi:predicted TPR repeat methyltransferase